MMKMTALIGLMLMGLTASADQLTYIYEVDQLSCIERIVVLKELKGHQNLDTDFFQSIANGSNDLVVRAYTERLRDNAEKIDIVEKSLKANCLRQ